MAGKAARAPSYHHGDLKNALVVAAARLIEKRRDTAFTVRELATAAGVSHPAAYRHFASKSDILAAVAESGFARLQAAFAAAREAHPSDVRQELIAQGEAYVRFAVEHVGYFRAMFHSELGNHGDYPGLLKVGNAAFESLFSAVKRGVEAGVFIDRSPLELAVMSWATVHGLATLIVDGRLANPMVTEAPAHDLAQLVTRLMMTGLDPRAGPKPRPARRSAK